MATMTTSVGDISALSASWARSLRVQAKSPATIRSYTEAVRFLTDFLREAGMPTDVTNATREHVSAFIEDQIERNSASSAALRFSACKVFFGWCVEEGELKASPMMNMKKPRKPEALTEIPSDDDLKRLLASLNGDDFDSLRDKAVIRVFMSTGARLAGVAGLRVEDVDLDRNTITITEKGDRTRTAYLDAKAVHAIDRYIRRGRNQRARARSQWLWLGQKGRFTKSGMGQMVRVRAKALGFRLHAHQFRHRWAAVQKSKGMHDGYIMALGGWRDIGAMRRYGQAVEASQVLDVARALDDGRDI